MSDEYKELKESMENREESDRHNPNSTLDPYRIGETTTPMYDNSNTFDTGRQTATVEEKEFNQ